MAFILKTPLVNQELCLNEHSKSRITPKKTKVHAPQIDLKPDEL